MSYKCFQRVPSAEIDRLLFEQDDGSTATETADEIIRKAQIEARDLIKRARLEARDILTESRRRIRREFTEQRRQHYERHLPRATERLMGVAGELRDDFDGLSDWLSDFVSTCINRIASDLPLETVQSVIATAISDYPSRWALRLRTCESEVEYVREALRGNPILNERIPLIIGDPELEPGALRLETPEGFSDVGLAVQLELLQQSIEKQVDSMHKVEEPSNDIVEPVGRRQGRALGVRKSVAR